MPEDFDRAVLGRLPLAEAILALWAWCADDRHLQELFDRHKGPCYDAKLTFPVLVGLLRDALLEHRGSASQSIARAGAAGRLPAARSCVYDKLARLPTDLSSAFLACTTDRLLQALPRPALAQVPTSLGAFEVVVLDGKVVKRVPKRLKPLRRQPGGLLGGKGLAALHLRSGLALALACHPDGDANEARLVPALLPQVRSRLAGVRLWLADSQFGDLTQTAAFAEGGDHFLVRYHPKAHFAPDPSRPPRAGVNGQGLAYREDWGWLGREGNPRRRYVRRLSLALADGKAVVLVSDLLDAAAYPAEDLLAAYLARWGVERVFQQITEVFHLAHLIGTTPKGTLFQLAFCLALYNLIQVVRGWVAAGAGREAEGVSAELLFGDVHRQLVALYEVLGVAAVVRLVRPAQTAEQLRARLGALLGGVWTDRWLKAKPKRRAKGGAAAAGKREHGSVYRILRDYHQKLKESITS
jgi:Transposase DDE domain